MPTCPPAHESASVVGRRRANTLRLFSRSGFALSAAVFGLNLAWALPVSGDPVDLVNTRGLRISPAFGDSSTEIALTLAPPDNVCPGDTTTGNFRWTTFMMPAAVPMATMTYDSNGPLAPSGVSFASPLFSFGDLAPLVDRSTTDVTGRIEGTTTIGFRGLTPGQLAAGQYKIGYACTQEPSPGRPAITHRFWQFILTIAPSETGGPARFVWTIETLLPTTTGAPTIPITLGPTSTVAPTATSATSPPVGPTSTLVQGIGVVVPTTMAAATTTTATTTTATTTTATTTSAATTTVAGATTTTSVSSSTSAPTTMAATSGATTTTVQVASAPVIPPSAAVGSSSGGVASGGATSGGPTPVSGLFPTTGASHVVRLLVSGLALVYFGSLVVATARPRRPRRADPVR